MFIVMRQHTKSNSLYVKTYLAINLILVLLDYQQYVLKVSKVLVYTVKWIPGSSILIL